MADMLEPPGWLTPPYTALWFVRYHDPFSAGDLEC